MRAGLRVVVIRESAPETPTFRKKRQLRRSRNPKKRSPRAGNAAVCFVAIAQRGYVTFMCRLPEADIQCLRVWSQLLDSALMLSDTRLPLGPKVIVRKGGSGSAFEASGSQIGVSSVS
jgi:hypothetical protein